MGKPDKPKSVKPPALPPPVATPREISVQAAKIGEAEGRKLRKRTGRRATRVTTPGFLTPAPVEKRKLKTTLA